MMACHARKKGMSSDRDDGVVEGVEAFEVVGHEIRLAIIEALAERRREAWLPKGLGFADLCDAVGVDDTGKFNYHLGELRGTYVEERDGEYVLTNAGFEIAGALRAATFGATDDLSRRERVDQTCHACDDALEAVYEDGYLRLACQTHGPVLATTLPPAAVRGRDVEAVVDLARERSTEKVSRVQAGGCPHCWGRAEFTAPASPSREYLAFHWLDDVDGEAPPESTEGLDEPGADDSGGPLEQVVAEAACDDCGLRFWIPVSVVVADHPAVVAYYHEHGIQGDALDLPHVDGKNGTVVETDPVRIDVDVYVSGADEALVVTVDGTASVVDTRRETAGCDDRPPATDA